MKANRFFQFGPPVVGFEEMGLPLVAKSLAIARAYLAIRPYPNHPRCDAAHHERFSAG